MTRLLRATGVAVGYRRRRQPLGGAVLAGIDATLTAGELVCLLGPNGSGKSTLLRTLVGLQPPLAGRIELMGRDLAAYSAAEVARRVGVVLPERVHAGMLSAFELVSLGRLPYTGWSGKLQRDDRERTWTAICRVGIEHLAERPVDALSDGECQKVMIARALAQEPAILVLDEPTAFLDLPGRVEIMGLLRRLARVADGAGAHAVLLSTHDLDLALRIADRVWLLGAVSSLVSGAPEDLVLDGAFAAAFRHGEAAFDPLTGSFRVDRRAARPIGLEDEGNGDGVAYIWTRRALERSGYRVVDGDATLPRIVVRQTDGDLSWQARLGNTCRSYRSIGALVNDLRSRLPVTGQEDSF